MNRKAENVDEFVDDDTSNSFDRLSNDMSGFGPNHREADSIDDSESKRLKDARESCTTTGFDFYVGGLNNM